MFRRTTLIAAACVLAFCSAGVNAQSFPTKPIKILVAAAAGGPSDQMARAVALKLQEAWGKPVIVDNKPGAGGQIAVQVLKQADADGHTLFLGATEMFVINQSLYRNFSYDPLTELKIVAPLLYTPMLLVVSRDLPADSVEDLLDLAKKKSQGLSFASQGVGSIGHMLGVQFMQKTGAKLNHVPYKGSAPGLQDLMGGQVEMMFDVAGSSGPFITAGKLKPLAIAAPARAGSLPQVKTLTESGLPGLDASVWAAIAVKAGTPDPIMNQLHEQIAKAMRAPDVSKRFADQGWAPVDMELPQFNTFMRGEVARWDALIKASGATAE